MQPTRTNILYVQPILVAVVCLQSGGKKDVFLAKGPKFSTFPIGAGVASGPQKFMLQSLTYKLVGRKGVNLANELKLSTFKLWPVWHPNPRHLCCSHIPVSL